MREQGITQRELGERLGISKTSISIMMTGKQRTSAELLRILDVLGIPSYEAFPLSERQRELLGALDEFELWYRSPQLDDLMTEFRQRSTNARIASIAAKRPATRRAEYARDQRAVTPRTRRARRAGTE